MKVYHPISDEHDDSHEPPREVFASCEYLGVVRIQASDPMTREWGGVLLLRANDAISLAADMVSAAGCFVHPVPLTPEHTASVDARLLPTTDDIHVAIHGSDGDIRVVLWQRKHRYVHALHSGYNGAFCSLIESRLDKWAKGRKMLCPTREAK